MVVHTIRETKLIGTVRERESISLIAVSICHLEIPYFVKKEYYKKE